MFKLNQLNNKVQGVRAEQDLTEDDDDTEVDIHKRHRDHIRDHHRDRNFDPRHNRKDHLDLIHNRRQHERRKFPGLYINN